MENILAYKPDAMGEPKTDSAGEQPPDSIRLEAKRLLDEITQLKTQAEEQLKATEVARKKADDDATYAFQAKVNAEEHAKAIAVFKGQAEPDVTSIATNKKNTDELVAAITVAKASIDGDDKTISDLRKQADEATRELLETAQNGTERLEAIDKLKAAAEASSNAAKEALTAATQARTTAESAQKSVQEFSAHAEEHTENISENRKASEENSAQITELLTKAQAAEAKLEAVLEHLAKSDDIATKHEKRVEELSAGLKQLNEQAESLLPGATSAGLASAFNKQKGRFGEPQKRWLWTFMGCIGLLIVVSIPSFITAVFGVSFFGHEPDKTWDGVLRGLTVRLPIVLPLIWLAIYAGRNYMLSLRLEEDYAYKEAISTAFEGYRREMESIVAKDPSNATALTTLCVNVLTALAERPGRIYDGKHHDINLLTEVHGAVEKAADLSKRKVASQ